MQVEIWSDVVCPWCAIGARRFARALEAFAHRDEVTVRWRSFELDPDAPAELDEPLAAHLAAKYGVSLTEAEEMLQRMADHAAEEGLPVRFDRARRGNTFAAHRLTHLAADRGVQQAVVERLMRGYLCEGEPIGDPAALARLGAEAGLEAADAERVLAGDDYADAVRSDEADARALGIHGVPLFAIDRTYGVSGAQPTDVLTGALETAWAQRSDAQPTLR